MEKLLNSPVVYLTLFVIVLIVFWSVIIRFPWIIAIALVMTGVITFINHRRKEGTS